MKNAFFLLWMGIVACKGPLTWKQAKSDCPQTGICQLEIEEKSKLVWKQDGTCAFYPSVVKGNQIVVRYSFTQDRSRETKDAFHSEKIYLEFPSETTRLVLQDQALEKAGVFFGRFCYCKNSSGWVPIEKGRLSVTQKTQKSYRVQLEFVLEGMSQKLRYLDEVVLVEGAKTNE